MKFPTIESEEELLELQRTPKKQSKPALQVPLGEEGAEEILIELNNK